MVDRGQVEYMLQVAIDHGHEVDAELCRAWLALDAAPFGMLATYPEANDRATYLYFNGKGLVPIGVECRLVATPASGGPRDG